MDLTQAIYNITHNQISSQIGECGYDQICYDELNIIHETHEQSEL